MTDCLNLFSLGTFDGHVTGAGQRRDVRSPAGVRDLGWGLHKHEGAPRRGLVLTAFCGFEDKAVFLLLGETACARRVMTDGWWLHRDGAENVTTIDDELHFEDLLLVGGEPILRFPSRGEVRVRAEPMGRLCLAGVGSSTETAMTGPGLALFDISPAVRHQLVGQTDHGCRFELEGALGHGSTSPGSAPTRATGRSRRRLRSVLDD